MGKIPVWNAQLQYEHQSVFSYNPDLVVTWCVNCQIWQFETFASSHRSSSCGLLSTMHTHLR